MAISETSLTGRQYGIGSQFRFIKRNVPTVEPTLVSPLNAINIQDTDAYISRRRPAEWITHELSGRWIPDAFAWTMAELMESIIQNRTPINNGPDHIKTLQLVEAIYESMASGEAVIVNK